MVGAAVGLLLGGCAIGVPGGDSVMDAEWERVAAVTPSLPDPWVTDMLLFHDPGAEFGPGKTAFLVYDGTLTPGPGEEELISLCVQPPGASEPCGTDSPSDELEPMRRFELTPDVIEISCISKSCTGATLASFTDAWNSPDR